MATNDFLVFGGGAGANVITQVTYSGLSARTGGFAAGVAQSAQLNKVWRQSSIMAAVLAQFISDVTGQDALDDGSTATLLANLKAAAKMSGATVRGAFKNLQSSASGSNSTVNVSADELVLESAAGLYTVVKNVSLTPTTGGAVGANSLDTGTWAFSTWYSVWVIYNPTSQTTSALFSLSSTAPTLPSGYTFCARVGWIRTQAATNYWALAFRQFGRKVRYVTAASGTNLSAYPTMLSNGTATTYTAVATGSFVPPTAGEITTWTNNGNASTASVVILSADGVSQWTNAIGNGSFGVARDSNIPLFSTNIYYLASGTSPLANIYAVGWEDNL